MLEATTKVLDASSGESAAFSIKDNALSFKLIISGSPLANIKAFLIQSGSDQQFLKISCASWNGAEVELHASSGHADDAYTDTGVIFTKNALEIHFFK